jgi:hypothetical protein
MVLKANPVNKAYLNKKMNNMRLKEIKMQIKIKAIESEM